MSFNEMKLADFPGLGLNMDRVSPAARVAENVDLWKAGELDKRNGFRRVNQIQYAGAIVAVPDLSRICDYQKILVLIGWLEWPWPVPYPDLPTPTPDPVPIYEHRRRRGRGTDGDDFWEPYPIQVTITADPVGGVVPIDIDFACEVTNWEGEVLEYEWRVNGVVVGTGPTLTHNFDWPGTYTVQLIVLNDLGGYGGDSVTVTITNTAPVAVASVVAASGEAPFDAQFIGDLSFDPDGHPLTYDWDFGDGSPHSSAANPAHTYVLPNIYTATLTVTDPYGLSDSMDVDVHARGMTDDTMPAPGTYTDIRDFCVHLGSAYCCDRTTKALLIRAGDTWSSVAIAAQAYSAHRPSLLSFGGDLYGAIEGIGSAYIIKLVAGAWNTELNTGGGRSLLLSFDANAMFALQFVSAGPPTMKKRKRTSAGAWSDLGNTTVGISLFYDRGMLGSRFHGSGGEAYQAAGNIELAADGGGGWGGSQTAIFSTSVYHGEADANLYVKSAVGGAWTTIPFMAGYTANTITGMVALGGFLFVSATRTADGRHVLIRWDGANYVVRHVFAAGENVTGVGSDNQHSVFVATSAGKIYREVV